MIKLSLGLFALLASPLIITRCQAAYQDSQIAQPSLASKPDHASVLTLQDHPRVYMEKEWLQRPRHSYENEFLQNINREVAEEARSYAESTEIEYDKTTHNAHLNRARILQRRVITLLVRYFQTKDAIYKEAVREHIQMMDTWEYWSWITWRQGNSDPHAIYDLSYGENSTTLALAYDWLYHEWSAEDKEMMQAIARKWSFGSFLHQVTEREEKPWWFGVKGSNWNTVCAGGAGMLALAMYEDVPEAPEVLALVEESVEPYMRHMERLDGGWEEGIGYWNYGNRYAFMYLLSYEFSTGKAHPLMELSSTRNTLRFPLDFCPNGVPTSFGDVNRFEVLPFHFAAAQRYEDSNVIWRLDNLLKKETRSKRNPLNHPAEMLLVHPESIPGKPHYESPTARLYPEMDWAVLADRMPDPRLYLSIRGGTTEVWHGHMDLMSFHCVVNQEAMITNIGPDEYLDTTFGSRRYEMFEFVPASKNTILVNGVGITKPAHVDTTLFQSGDSIGVRIDATEAMGMTEDGRGEKPGEHTLLEFCGRLFVMIDETKIAIIDRVEARHFARVESRMFTPQTAHLLGEQVTIRGKQETLYVYYGATKPARLLRSTTAPTTPKEGISMLRWCVNDLVESVSLVTLLSLNEIQEPIKISEELDQLHIKLAGHQLRMTHRLEQVSVE